MFPLTIAVVKAGAVLTGKATVFSSGGIGYNVTGKVPLPNGATLQVSDNNAIVGSKGKVSAERLQALATLRADRDAEKDGDKRRTIKGKIEALIAETFAEVAAHWNDEPAEGADED